MALADPARRVALIIGNGAYTNLPTLTNPVNDARLIAQTVAQLGFTLVDGGPQVNLTKAGMERVIRDFSRQLGKDTVALFYYAGHGLQFDGHNYLVPVDANPSSAADADFQFIGVDLILRQMALAGDGLNLLVLDACRNNPFASRGLRGIASGLAEMHAPSGTLIAYATQPGGVARDGDGRDSPFSKALANEMRKPDVGLFDLFNQVAVQVEEITHDAQQPWFSASPLKGHFIFAEPLRAWMGVRIQPVTATLAAGIGLPVTTGALITGLNPGGPAEAAGLRGGDILLRLDNRDIGDFRELPRVVAAHMAGEAFTAVVWRQGRKIVLRGVFGRLPDWNARRARVVETPPAASSEPTPGTAR